MASSLVLKSLGSSNLCRSFYCGVRPVTPAVQSAHRLFNTISALQGSESDHILTNPFSGEERAHVISDRQWFEINKMKDEVQLRIDMPGVGKENLKVSLNQNMLFVQGNEVAASAQKSKEESGEGRSYDYTIALPNYGYKTDGITSVMKNGVLRMVFPKIKQHERTDLIPLNID